MVYTPMLLHHTFSVQESASADREHYLHITTCTAWSTSSEPPQLLPGFTSITHFQHIHTLTSIHPIPGGWMVSSSLRWEAEMSKKIHVPSLASKHSVVSKIPYYIILITASDHINYTWSEVSYELSTTVLFFHRTTVVRQSTWKGHLPWV